MTFVSVVIPYKQHGAMLDECLEHLARQTYCAFDIILVPDGEDAVAGDTIRVLAHHPGVPNRKRFAAALSTRSALLAFIDDDAFPDPNWLAAAVAHFDDASVVAAGGPSVTPANDGPLERAGGAVYASPLVTSVTRHRYVAERARDVDVLPTCNLVVRRDAFIDCAQESLPFYPGEDILVCQVMTANGKRIVYDPHIVVNHHRRALFAAHLRQVWAYARFRGFYLRRCNRSARNVVYAAPAAFVVAHAVALVAVRSPRWRVPVLVAAACYASAVAISAAREAPRDRAQPGLVAIGIYLTHLAYGAGSIVGWFQRDGTTER